jgi:membrane protein YqaA with SNARE-associated domain
MKFFRPLLTFIFHLGYFGPLVMGVVDSSFLFLPFGNDLVVVGLVAQKHHHAWLYVVSAAAGSTVGAVILALVARKVGEEKVRELAGEKRFKKLSGWIDQHAVLSIAAGALAPPPFPYTMVIAAASALDYPIARIALVNGVARLARFALLAFLAMKFGNEVLRVAKSAPFVWCMIAFILLCFVGSGFSLWKWFRGKSAPKATAGNQQEPQHTQ